MQTIANFEVLIDDLFENLNTDTGLSPTKNKRVISIINDYEDTNWRYSKFQSFVWDNIAETSLSVKERDSLIGLNHSLLVASAQNLRLTDKADDISQGSELAEIVLYGIMKHHFKALPVVPKIFYKQNTQDNAKGADSVHIVVKDDDFTIWFGEAKFYNSIEDTRLNEIIQSVEKSLSLEKIKKENAIITNVSDIDLLIDDVNLKASIKKALSPRESIDDLKPKLHIPILLLHECSITSKHRILSDAYKNEIIDFHKKRAQSYFKKQVAKLTSVVKYSEINFHIILFPVPSKDKIIDRFVSMVEAYKKEGKDGDI